MHDLLTEAAQAVVDFLFREVHVHRVEITHAVKNPGSGAVARKCGLTLEGIRREYFKAANGEYLDIAAYAILREAWEAKAQLIFSKMSIYPFTNCRLCAILYLVRGALAQLVAHNTGSVGVRSSNLLCSTNKKPLSHKGLRVFVVFRPLHDAVLHEPARYPHPAPDDPGRGGCEHPAVRMSGIDLSFVSGKEKFNYRVCAVIISEGKLLAMHDERSPYYYLPAGGCRWGKRRKPPWCGRFRRNWRSPRKSSVPVAESGIFHGGCGRPALS